MKLQCSSLIFQLDIADVTNFVHPGTPLDDEAAKRGTSVYLVERRIDMLPKPLTEGKFMYLFMSVSTFSSLFHVHASHIKFCLAHLGFKFSCRYMFTAG